MFHFYNKNIFIDNKFNQFGLKRGDLMATIIKVNGQTITIANKSSEAFDLLAAQKENIAIENMSSGLTASIEALNLIADTKAMESFGYKSTEAVSEKLQNTGKAILDKLKAFWEKVKHFVTVTVPKFFKDLWAKIQKFLKGEFDTEKYVELMCSSQKGLALYESVVFDGKDTLDKLTGFKYTGDLIKDANQASVLKEAKSNLSKCDNIESVKSKLKNASISGDKFRHSVGDKFEKITKEIGTLISKYEGLFKGAENNDTNPDYAKCAAVLTSLQELSVLICDVQSKSANAFLNSAVKVGALTKAANAGKVAAGAAVKASGKVAGANIGFSAGHIEGVGNAMDNIGGQRSNKVTNFIGEVGDRLHNTAEFGKVLGKATNDTLDAVGNAIQNSQRDKEYTTKK